MYIFNFMTPWWDCYYNATRVHYWSQSLGYWETSWSPRQAKSISLKVWYFWVDWYKKQSLMNVVFNVILWIYLMIESHSKSWNAATWKTIFSWYKNYFVCFFNNCCVSFHSLTHNNFGYIHSQKKMPFISFFYLQEGFIIGLTIADNHTIKFIRCVMIWTNPKEKHKGVLIACQYLLKLLKSN